VCHNFSRVFRFRKKLGVQPFAHYCRIVGSDLYWVEEDIQAMMKAQVLLAWLLNDQPVPPKHGAPLRLIILPIRRAKLEVNR
jgi:DMSO/TMAO reductase YedYZ molybdopterin-dependent catalytic subunit